MYIVVQYFNNKAGYILMVEHDFYKLMQIKTYADAGEVKKRYYELALLYHPDKSPKNKDAEEYFKIITQGYNLLGDADKKLVYDDLLRNYYERLTTKRRDPPAGKDLSERLFQRREQQRQDIIRDYLETEDILSHKKRFIISILITMSGFLLTFNHWYLNYYKLDTIYNFAGFLICYTGCYLIANNIYRRDTYKNAIRLDNKTGEKRAIRVFLGLFFMLPVIFGILITFSARIQLTYFAEYTTVKSITVQNHEVFYEYSVNNTDIKRNTNLVIDERTLQTRPIRVKYSRLNPNISELVLLE